MRRWARDMGRAFESWGIPTMPLMNAIGDWPAVEVLERGGRLVVRAELPGVNKDDVRLRVLGDALVIEGERRSQEESEGRGYYRSEWSYGRFSRRIPLPAAVNLDSAQARFQDGVLDVSFELPESVGREVAIESGGGNAERGTERGGGTR